MYVPTQYQITQPQPKAKEPSLLGAIITIAGPIFAMAVLHRAADEFAKNLLP
jgi:hypothetical protein